ncbi:putative transmembrane protein [Tieghemostelium lacteum]|uniref:Putative transmembrane protein n=1 Tax=Tieghemostelium lacteum TaxID=361077 RepID=A0A151ZHM8_TIELA|nr:putative transmembrane protein [Tieghemostelium lacteum]|eukprot:KYQ93476.1 putative transmembrane protein [Tieghemostelium lacteum]
MSILASISSMGKYSKLKSQSKSITSNDSQQLNSQGKSSTQGIVNNGSIYGLLPIQHPYIYFHFPPFEFW